MFGADIDASWLQVLVRTAWVFVPLGVRATVKLAERSVQGVCIGLGQPLKDPVYLIQLPNVSSKPRLSHFVMVRPRLMFFLLLLESDSM